MKNLLTKTKSLQQREASLTKTKSLQQREASLTKTKSLQQKKASVSFLSKIICFALIGGSGFFMNYFISYLFSSGILFNWWYIHASIFGIAVSMTSNFILNKRFTFKDKNFTLYHVFKQYAFYVLFTIIGAIIQIFVLYFFVEEGLTYPISLLLGVIVGSISNFMLNKKWTFYEKIWS
jgi:dolichol-phosphate mannosyltransferase